MPPRERDPDEARDMALDIREGIAADRREARAIEWARAQAAEEMYAARFDAREEWVY
jgi:hypothetical protein